MKMSLGRVMALAAVPALLLAAGAGSVSARPVSGGPPPPKGFEADSASFVSAQAGLVLGARKCSLLPCTALLEKTVNGGKTWAAVPMPAVRPAVELVPSFTAFPATAVSTVRFENAQVGWLFNPGLWQTTDAGRHWQRVRLPGVVTTLAASDGVVFAVTEPANGSSNAARLYESAVGSGKWTLVRGVAPRNTLTVFGRFAWAGVAPSMWRTANSGKTWTRLTFGCPASHPDPSAVAAASPGNVALACSSQSDPQPGMSKKWVYVSADGGRTFARVTGQLSLDGEIGLIAMPPGRPLQITLTATSGATFMYRTVSDGKTWTERTFSDAGLDFRDLAYVSASVGYLVHFNGGPALAYGMGLLKTVTAGASWSSVLIP